MPNNNINGRTFRERLLSRLIIDPSGCVLWTGKVDKCGYGQLGVAGRTIGVHRLVWEMFEGPIPEGFHIDHVRDRGCHNRHCAAIAHLEPVTPRENNRRIPLHSFSLANSLKTHCKNGHPFDAANTYIAADDGGRRCRACNRAAVRRYTAKRRAS